MNDFISAVLINTPWEHHPIKPELSLTKHFSFHSSLPTLAWVKDMWILKEMLTASTREAAWHESYLLQNMEKQTESTKGRLSKYSHERVASACHTWEGTKQITDAFSNISESLHVVTHSLMEPFCHYCWLLACHKLYIISDYFLISGILLSNLTLNKF